MNPFSPSISFHFQKAITLRERARLKDAMRAIFTDFQKEVESVSFVFCSDDFLLDINRRFLNHDYYTDIITFNLSDPGSPIIGEIYISVDTVRANAAELGVSLTHELHRVAFHGALHLCGLDDSTPETKATMTQAENKLISTYFVSRETG